MTEADIDAICTRSTECTVFQMVDAQVAGRNDVAFGLLKDMVRAGEDRIGILAMLLRQYRILYHMRSLMDERAPQQSQASLLGIPPFAVSRTQQQARRYDRARLKEAYESLLDYEQRDQGRPDPAGGLRRKCSAAAGSHFAGIKTIEKRDAWEENPAPLF